MRRPWSLRATGLAECHRITRLVGVRSWSIVVHGPRVRRWGFFDAGGFTDWEKYDATVRARRRDMFVDVDGSGRNS